MKAIYYVYNFGTKLWESASAPTLTRKELPAFLKQKLADGVDCYVTGSYGARYECYLAPLSGELQKRRVL